MRYHGVFAPRATLRPLVVPERPPPEAAQAEGTVPAPPPPLPLPSARKGRRYLAWAECAATAMRVRERVVVVRWAH